MVAVVMARRKERRGNASSLCSRDRSSCVELRCPNAMAFLLKALSLAFSLLSRTSR